MAMHPRLWVPPLVFVATAVPTVLALHRFELGGEYRIVIAIVVGAVATAVAQSRLATPTDPDRSDDSGR